MADKWIDLKLDCGINVRSKTTTNKNVATEWLEISLYDFYQGCGNLNNPKTLANLFQELANKNFTLKGLSLDKGFYDSIDGVILDATREFEV